MKLRPIKILKIISILIFIVTILNSCEKYKDGEGYVTIYVKYNGSRVSDAIVYLKKGTSTNPNIPFDQYDIIVTTNDKGRVKIDGVKPAYYFIHAKKFLQNENRYIEGDYSLQVFQKFRLNTYDVNIDVQ